MSEAIITVTAILIIAITAALSYVVGYIKGYTQRMLRKEPFEHVPERPTIPID